MSPAGPPPGPILPRGGERPPAPGGGGWRGGVPPWVRAGGGPVTAAGARCAGPLLPATPAPGLVSPGGERDASLGDCGSGTDPPGPRNGNGGCDREGRWRRPAVAVTGGGGARTGDAPLSFRGWCGRGRGRRRPVRPPGFSGVGTKAIPHRGELWGCGPGGGCPRAHPVPRGELPVVTGPLRPPVTPRPHLHDLARPGPAGGSVSIVARDTVGARGGGGGSASKAVRRGVGGAGLNPSQ